MNTQKDLQRMMENYISGRATAEETKFIETYYKHLDAGIDPLAHLSAPEIEELEERNFSILKAKINGGKTERKTIPFYRYIAAAIILVSISFITYYAVSPKKEILTKAEVANVLDALPGSDKAILTLADGSKVVLDDHAKSNISKSSFLTISKTENGQLIYKVIANGDINSSKIAYNTIETPRGGQYQVVLPDGTKVWINAASSLKYPEIFRGNERKVELTGEAYFEVAKNKTLPFRVMSKNQEVEVLGTHFNINTYMDDKSIKTTLLEGSIKISNQKSVKILSAGEQAVIADYGLGAIIVNPNIDTDNETAWKNGQFRFNNAGLKSILNQLERWYDIDIDYATVPDRRFNGMVPRNAKLSEVLNMLSLTGNIAFEIKEGKRLKVFTK